MFHFYSCGLYALFKLLTGFTVVFDIDENMENEKLN